MPTNAMGRDSQRPGNTGASSGGRGTNADKDRAARASMGAAMAGRDRPQRTAHTDFITPKYNWDQAQISDFGITGGLMNAIGGVMAGNTYAGRTPIGFGNHNIRGGGGAGNAMTRPPQVNAPQMFMPQAQPARPSLPTPRFASAPGMFMNTGGKYGAGVFRPGYNFIQGGF